MTADPPAPASLSPWEVLDFAAYVRERNVTFKREGDAALDPATRRYFDRLETAQAREAAEIKGPKA